jgi:hypothetical protein
MLILHVERPPPIQRPGGQDGHAQGQEQDPGHRGSPVRVPDPHDESGVGLGDQQEAQNPDQSGGHHERSELPIAEGEKERARSNREESVRPPMSPHRVCKGAAYYDVEDWSRPPDWKNGEGSCQEHGGKRVVQRVIRPSVTDGVRIFTPERMRRCVVENIEVRDELRMRGEERKPKCHDEENGQDEPAFTYSDPPDSRHSE